MIDINPHQARQQFDEDALEELAASIKDHDVLQPIGVIHSGERYQIIFGERRYRAAIMAEKSDIPAVIYKDLSEQDAAILTALENLQREDLDLEDEARQFSYLLEVTGLSQRALAERLGKTHNYISRRVRLLRERPELFAAIREGRVTQREALDQLALEGSVYHGDTGNADTNSEPDSADTASASTPDRQVGVYHGDTLVSVISIEQESSSERRTPRREMPTPRAGVPARWQAITRTYRVLGKIQPEEVPIEECEDLAHQLEDLETLVASTRRALEARLSSKSNAPTDQPAGAGSEPVGSTVEEEEKLF
jgi:ParB/RepB/Spo0J family partition protein